MIPLTPWRERVLIAIALLRGRIYLDNVRSPGWGQTIRLRTVDNVHSLREGQR